MKDIELPPCPFCGSAPRYLEHKAGFYSERVICDSCGFHLPPEKWRLRAAVEADRAQRVPVASVRDAVTKNGPLWEKFYAVYETYCGRQITIREIAWRCFLAASTPAQPAQRELEKALEPRMSRACLDAWDKSSFTAGSHDAVHPMFLEAFSAGFKAASAHQEPPQPVERKPMTDEQVYAMCDRLGIAQLSPLDLVAEVERHHGIRE